MGSELLETCNFKTKNYENDIDEANFNHKINARRYDAPLYIGIPSKIIIIASTPRSGSNLFISGLQSISLMEKSSEFFNGLDIADYKLRWGNDISKDEYVKKLFMHRTTPQGLFIAKCHYKQFSEYSNTLMKYKCKFISISRRNMICQAISLYIARYITRSWWSFRSIEKAWRSIDDKIRNASYDDYSFDGILKEYHYLDTENKLWNNFFRANSINPITTVWYEELSAHYSEVIATVAMQITGTPFSRLQIPPPELKKQADDVSEYFYRRFIDDVQSHRLIR